MVADIEYKRTDETEHNRVVSLLLAIRSSFIYFIAALGTVCLLMSVVLSPYVPGIYHGVLSAMFVVWGTSAFVYAALGYAGLRLIGYQ